MRTENKLSTPNVRKVIVDIATHDDHGNPITDAMLSSGGARDRGPLVKQYTNPQPYEQAPVRSDEDRKVGAYKQRQADTRQRREELAEELCRRKNQEFAVALLKPVLDGAERVVREIFIPWARGKWDQRESCKPTARESEAVDSTVIDPPDTNDHVVGVAERGVDVRESAPVQPRAFAPVVQIEEYRRSA